MEIQKFVDEGLGFENKIKKFELGRIVAGLLDLSPF